MVRLSAVGVTGSYSLLAKKFSAFGTDLGKCSHGDVTTTLGTLQRESHPPKISTHNLPIWFANLNT